MQVQFCLIIGKAGWIRPQSAPMVHDKRRIYNTDWKNNPDRVNPYKNFPLVRIPPSIFQQIRKGSPWIFRDSLTVFPEIREILPEGGWVQISASKNPGGLALFDPNNAIALRVLDSSPDEIPFKPFLRRKIISVIHLRRYIDQSLTNGFRLIHGEGDFLPGLTIDYYNGLLVIRPDCAAWIPHLQLVLEYIEPELAFDAALLIYERKHEWLKGEMSLPHEFLENSLRFLVDPSVGQKTGFFLDMRDNRLAIKGLAAGKKILNCFSYTGAFSVYARSGGAVETLNVEISQGALDSARENHAINGFNDEKTDYISRDAFEYLEELPVIGPRKVLKEKCPFDMIILDPPAFAHSQEKVASAIDSYIRLNQMAIERLGSGQYLATASCSSRILPEQFFTAISESAQLSGKRLKMIYSHGAGIDHPVAINSGISPYLKFNIYIVE